LSRAQPLLKSLAISDYHRNSNCTQNFLVSRAMLIGLCGLSAWMLTWLLHLDALTAYLSTSPGGLDSVAIIAVGSNADIATVLAIQTLRLFVVILVGPQVAKLISRYG